MSTKVQTFKDLIVWRKAHQIVLEVYKLTAQFPPEEKFGLIHQIRRAAYSIPANIVEGHSRKSKNEFLHFLSIAKGSLEEVRYFVIRSADLNYITNEAQNNLQNQLE